MSELWLKGPIHYVPDLLQPVAHALLQAKEEINEMMKNFEESLLWRRPASVASVAFHLQHIAGVQDRLLTYAKEKMLNDEQLIYLQNEGKENETITLTALLENVNRQTEKSIEQLKETDPNTLTDKREVGRKKLPSTVLGLLFHSAEHTMRHTGQMLVTVTILKAGF
ncbi:MAG: DinB family protein [Parafilimonas sp.]|nr:DinB family protein [Parafilimonas sp.]